MNRLKKKFYLFESVYIMFLVFLALVYYVPVFSIYIDPVFDFAILIGFVLAFIETIKKIVYIYKNKEHVDIYFILLSLFTLSYIVTICINGFMLNDFKVLIYFYVCFYLLYLNKDEKTFNKVSNMVFYYSLITGILALILLSLKICFMFRNELTTDVGFMGVHPNHSLYGFIGNSNRMSWLAIFGIFSSLYFCFKNKHTRKNNILIINIILQIILIFLSNSRGGFIGLLVFLSVFTFLHFFKNKKLGKTLLIVFMVVLMVFVSSKLTKNTETMILGDISPKTIYVCYNNNCSKMVNNDNDETVSEQTVENERSEGEKVRTSKARIEALVAGFGIFKDNILFGVGRENIENKIVDYLPENSLLYGYQLVHNLHNIYITVLASSGLIGFILLALFICIGLYKFIRVYNILDDITYLQFSLMIAFFVINLFESEILYCRTFSAFIFWINLGNMYKNIDNCFRLRIVEKGQDNVK